MSTSSLRCRFQTPGFVESGLAGFQGCLWCSGCRVEGFELGGWGRFEEAITAHQDAAAILREVGDAHRLGIARAGLEAALRQRGRRGLWRWLRR
jgi:hypothetical protein